MAKLVEPFCIPNVIEPFDLFHVISLVEIVVPTVPITTTGLFGTRATGCPKLELPGQVAHIVSALAVLSCSVVTDVDVMILFA
jgi:hypothetical protein